jgi:hypothetical protein
MQHNGYLRHNLLANSNDLQNKIANQYVEYRHALIWNAALQDEPKLTKGDAYSILRHSSAWMIRNIFDFDCPEETNFWYIIKDRYAVEDYSKKTKKYIEKANNKFQIRLISKERILQQGYSVYSKAHAHYKVNDGFVMSKDQYIAEISAMDNTFEFWGCIDKETDLLQAYSICHVHDGMCWFKYSRANPEFLPKYYPMYGMYDARNQYYLGEHKVRYVMTSARSITEHSEIQSFLIEKFAFRRAYCRVKIYYKPWLRILVNFAYPFRRVMPIRAAKNLLSFERINRGGV